MSNPQQDYTEFLDALHGLPEGSSAREGWAIRDDGAADWALRKVGQIQAQQRHRAAYVAAEIERLEAWQAHEDQQAQRAVDFFTSHLQSYGEELAAQGIIHERKRSHKLPHGSIGFRAAPVEYERDDAQIIAWMKANPGLMSTCIRTKEELAWSEVKPLLEPGENQAMSEVMAFGEVVPGLRVKQPRRDVFEVKPKID